MMNLNVGEYVQHETLGLGKVLRFEKNNVYVEFSKAQNYFIPVEQADAHLKPYRFAYQDDVVRHPTYGIGLIRANDHLEATVEFTIAGVKTMDWMTVERRCTKLNRGGLGNYLFDHRKNAYQLIKADPSLLIKLALIDLGKEARTDDIKRELMLYGFIKESDWATWWKEVANLLRKDPIFDTSDSRKQIYRLREQPKSELDELLDRFLAGSDHYDECFRVAKQIYEKFGRSLTLQQIETFSQFFVANLNDETKDPSEHVQSYILLKKLRPDFSFDISNIVKPGLDISRIIHSANAEEVLDLVDSSIAGWEDILFTGLGSKAPKIRDYCLQKLSENQKWDYINNALKIFMSGLPKKGEIYLWLADACLEKNYPVEFKPHQMIEKAFVLISDEKNRERAIEFVAGEDHIRKVAEALDDQALLVFLENYFRNDELSIFFKELILSVLEDKEKDNMVAYFSGMMGKQMKKTEVIEMSQKELEVMEKKFNHHLDEELVDVTQKLAAATADSPEYLKYYERQQAVIKRVQHLKQTLKNCRVIER